MPQYMFSLIDDGSWYDAPPEQWAAEMKLHDEFAAAVAAAGASIVAGAALERQSTATTVHQSDGEITLTDGPFAETKEALGGFYVVEAADLDTALQLAKVCPSPHVEVRPVMDFSQL
jgi:hypothetical protein